jgi:thiamine biosynthesis lipoprotein
MSRTIERIDFHAMGTEFFCIVTEPEPGLFDNIYELAVDLDSKWSRFKPTSELMQLNNSPEVAIAISPGTIRLIKEMKNAYEISGGLYDPNVLGAMIDAGFASSKDDASNISIWKARENSANSIMDVEINELNSTATIPLGVGLDAGGIGKGLAADLIATRAIELGAMGIAVFAGGDVTVRGISESGEGWEIGVQDPSDPTKFVDTVRLSIGGLATSGLDGWLTKSGRSHIIDPKTMKSAQSSVIQATVVAHAAVHAEALTKVSFLLPVEEAILRIEDAGAQALLFDEKFERYETTEWKKYT